MASEKTLEQTVATWLKTALKDVENLSVKIIGTSEKGDGYGGDILFVDVTGTDRQGLKRDYNLVLKCSSSSEALMNQMPEIREVFFIEKYVYEKVFPAFRQLQLDKGTEPFDSVPRSYGSYSDEFRDVIILENLKKNGYQLWDYKIPLTRKHIDLVIGEYAKFHAISVALKEQQFEKFQALVDKIKGNVVDEIYEKSGFLITYKNIMSEVCDIIKDDIHEDILEKWLKLREQVPSVISKMGPEEGDLEVVTHGDCWNNNLMFKYTDEENSLVSTVAMIDWQMASLTTPIKDISYFLFSCISEEDLVDINTILKQYHETFTDYLIKLGSSFGKHYSFEKFLKEWKKFSKFGLTLSLMPLEAAYADKSELPDLAESAESGQDIIESFVFKITDISGFKKRIIPIFQHAVESELI